MNLSTYTPGRIISCPTCHNQFRCEAIMVELAGHPRYCPYCGSTNITLGIDQDKDFWYALTAELGFKPTKPAVEMVQELYKLWNPGEHKRFGDFVKAFENDS